MLSNCGVGEDSWESLGLQGSQTSPSQRKSTLNIHWKDLCWSWSSNSLATWCEESTLWKRPWCWERLRAGREGDDRGWDGWMASPAQWTWIWTNCEIVEDREVGLLQFMGSQRLNKNNILHETLTIAGICHAGITIADNLESATSIMAIHCHSLGSLEGDTE